jgi:hypothetical protein
MVADVAPVPLPLTVKSGAGAFTVWFNAAEVLVANVASPEYFAVMEWAPEASADVVRVAFPALSVPLPREFVPSRNETVPEGVPGEPLLTVAVSVTDWPVVDGFADDVTTVLVVAVG